MPTTFGKLPIGALFHQSNMNYVKQSETAGVNAWYSHLRKRAMLGLASFADFEMVETGWIEYPEVAATVQ